MSTGYLVLVALFAAAEGAAPLAGLLIEPNAGVERALENNPKLLQQHRGYLAWLEKHPSIATAEDAFTSLMPTRGFSAAFIRFDEALVRYPDVAHRMDTYYSFLVRDSAARTAVDDLHRFELARRGTRETWGPALAYLRAHPDKALTFLENPRWVKPLPEALAPLAEAARKKKPLVERLQTDFQTLHDNAQVHLRVFPWWKTAYDAESSVEKAFGYLNTHFSEYPHRFWVWHRRELALAHEPDARAWLRHWHRLVRRTDGLDRAYWIYLDRLRRQPELREVAERRWRNEYEPLPAWPPDRQPPKLSPLWTPEEDKPTAKRPDPVEIEKPARPDMPRTDDFPRPTPPEKPVRPARPTKKE
ncbi:MAG: hypothetical protein R6V12_13435 [Candidatus Hydrogenedentota bacterium]